MILDNITLTGQKAYLRDAGSNINLAAANTIPNTGSTPKLGKGIVMDIAGVNLLMESNDLYALMARGGQQLLRVDVVKEMFPGLFADPYKHRVHLVSGYDDFNRGSFTNCRMMDIEGFPTLVSIGTEDCQWKSEIYVFDQLPDPLIVKAAAWDLASPRLTPDDGFEYSLKLHIWKTGADTKNNPSDTIILADKLQPRENRFIDNVDSKANDIYAYQFEFSAKVMHDSYIKERYLGKYDTANLGRPLLRAIHLLEPVEPTFEFYSLHELMANCPSYHFFEESSNPPKKLHASLAITAALEENESISITLLDNKITYLEARLNARVRMKPPVIDK